MLCSRRRAPWLNAGVKLMTVDGAVYKAVVAILGDKDFINAMNQ
jgi:hypothetical protein